MKKIIFLMFLNSILCHSQFAIHDISFISGARYNRSLTYEYFTNPNVQDISYGIRYYSNTRNWNPYYEVKFTWFKKEYVKNSILIESGLFFHQVFRNHYFDDISKNNDNNFNVLLLWLDYNTKSNHYGVLTNILVSKKLNKIFSLNYGLSYRFDYSVLKSIQLNRLSLYNEWEEINFPNKHKFKNKIAVDIYLYLQPRFRINDKLFIGINISLPTVLSGSFRIRKNYPIPLTENNFMNRNNYLGLNLTYKLANF